MLSAFAKEPQELRRPRFSFDNQLVKEPAAAKTTASGQMRIRTQPFKSATVSNPADKRHAVLKRLRQLRRNPVGSVAAADGRCIGPTNSNCQRRSFEKMTLR
ncbi:hypothetical protein [Chenggangzhangella methanolivorans]|uniref:Uncharacterized protein n=1 Tax=Chenggangzhangella methanolivorans TaxID=1437009 RepID=A0A9E6RCL2_9HYPH|nr:hypothetical protein [Chenggangzhangella methanolivorans]QZO01855.1 hypothetical protein K6K41_11190 [Chenggangzhangella methanolivorans]